MKPRGIFVLALLMRGASLFAQGNLTPPGPPAPIMKTLEQLEPRTPIADVPYVISRPGSYYLTHDLTNAGNENAITITAGNVSLDLSGFNLSSTEGNASGISVLAEGGANVKIHNGSIRNFGKHGITAANLTGAILRDIRVIQNGSGTLLGAGAIVEQCTAISNLNYGVNAGPGAHIRASVAVADGSFGFSAGDGSTFVDCVSSLSIEGFTVRNSSLANCSSYTNSFRGFNASQGSQFVNCVATANGVIGFSGNGEISISKCTARGNGDCGVALFKVFGHETTSMIRDSVMVNNVNYGLLAQARVSVFNSAADFNRVGGMQLQETGSAIGCTAVSNKFFGISVAAGSLVQDCTTTRNGSSGILAEAGTRVSGCNAFSNGLDGMNLRAGSTVTHCTARGNGDDGIEVTSDCVVSDNHCTGNGLSAATTGAGIHATLSSNRIEGNHATQNENGYRIDADGNTLFRNSARGNTTNWSIAPGNDVGPIGDAAIATSPFANIEF
ncbi:MAG TPA: right-handed parallel beta-helix repeat-containing protein [Candidatus Binatia bacterium]|nr:right-handed parallel beta-helix repeat-containing protein [Candidatus Binatia bacterium]